MTLEQTEYLRNCVINEIGNINNHIQHSFDNMAISFLRYINHYTIPETLEQFKYFLSFKPSIESLEFAISFDCPYPYSRKSETSRYFKDNKIDIDPCENRFKPELVALLNYCGLDYEYMAF